jgi:hypothetical protein
MSKHDETFDQIRRLHGGLHWKKVEALLKHLGAEVYEGSGSTVTFVLEERKLTVDRPHPRPRVRSGIGQESKTLFGAARVSVTRRDCRRTS